VTFELNQPHYRKRRARHKPCPPEMSDKNFSLSRFDQGRSRHEVSGTAIPPNLSLSDKVS